MASTYQYILTLNDRMSGAMRRAGVVGENTYNGLISRQEKYNSVVSSAGSMIGRLGAAFSVFSIGKGIYNAGVDMEQTRIAFSTFLGDVEKGNKLIADLNQFANVTPFENDETIKAGRSLLAANIEASKVVGTLRMIGDVASGTKVPLTEMTSIYAKAMNKGRIQAEELNQLAERGVPILNTFSKMFGVTTGEVMKMGEKGLLTSDLLTKAFDVMTSKGGMFFNLMEKQSQSAGGLVSTMLGEFQVQAIKLGEKLIPTIKVVVQSLISLAQWIGRNMDTLIAIGKVVAHVVVLWGIWKAAILAQIAITKVALMWEAIQLASINILGNGFMTASVGAKIFAAAQWAVNAAMAANPIGAVVAAIAALIFLVYKAWNAYEKWGAAAMWLLGPLGWIVNIVHALKRNWDSISDAFQNGGIIAGLKRIGIVLLDAILYPVQQLLTWLSKIPGLGKLTAKGAEKIADIRKGLNLVDPKAKKVVNNIENTTNNIPLPEGLKPSGVEGLGVAPGSLKDSNKGITSGGSRPTNITINLNNLVEELHVTPADLKEGVDEIERRVKEALLRVLNSANGVAYGN